ncbi:MAG: fructose-1,6-bisphosphatase, partial [Clostridia bacterium]
RSKVRKALPKDFAYVIEELINEKSELLDKEAYYEEIVNTIIRIGRAENFIVALSELIQTLVIDHLHVLGDIYDRGNGAVSIMDKLTKYHSVDVQWGNHDVVWMGAAVGQTACIANVVRVCAKYGNLDTLEQGYGINLLPLATFAIETYKDDNCDCFSTKHSPESSNAEIELNEKIHKAITIIQQKLEGQLIKDNPSFEMEDRLLLERIDIEKGTVLISDKEYQLLDTNFPTVDFSEPYKLTEAETIIIERLKSAFKHSEKLQNHVEFLLNKGGLYKVYNGNLLFHGCVPMDENAEFSKINIYGKTCKGKALYDTLESYARKAFFAINKEERYKGRDILWWIWCNKNSPLFGKEKMTNFERYFIAEKETHKELKNNYYLNIENETMVNMILKEFGLCENTSHIINGHVPVLQKKGESPVKCNGKVFVIDGGFAKAYQSATGIAGYTLIFNSYGLILVAHEPFISSEDAVENESDIVSHTVMIEKMPNRLSVGDTDKGLVLKERIAELEELLIAYRSGEIVSKLI